MSDAFTALQTAIASRSARVAVLGLDAIGLQRALLVSQSGFPVCGFDADSKLIQRLQNGPIGGSPCPSAVSELMQRGFKLSHQPAVLADADVLLINDPTPLNAARSPDLTSIARVSQTIAGQLRAGQFILLERTAYPGMTCEVIQPLLEKRGLKVGVDYFLGVCPSSNGAKATKFAAKRIAGGNDGQSLELALASYRMLGVAAVTGSSLEAVEVCVLAESVFQLVQAAVEHELKSLFARMNLDPHAVLELARSASSCKPLDRICPQTFEAPWLRASMTQRIWSPSAVPRLLSVMRLLLLIPRLRIAQESAFRIVDACDDSATQFGQFQRTRQNGVATDTFTSFLVVGRDQGDNDIDFCIRCN